MSETFWEFSVRTYRTDKVAEACLALQDERGVDVNMLLFCCWFAVTRGAQPPGLFQTIFEFSENWASQVVRPLRQVRTWMKLDGCHDPRVATDACMEFREKVKGVELTAEKMQQEVLESMVAAAPEVTQSPAEQLGAAVNNIRQYCSAKNIVIRDEDRLSLLTIIQAGLKELSSREIRDTLKKL